MSSSPAAAAYAACPSPRPAHSAPSLVGGNGWTRGTTVSVCFAEKERLSSNMPSGSALRSVSGPISKRPRCSERIR